MAQRRTGAGRPLLAPDSEEEKARSENTHRVIAYTWFVLLSLLALTLLGLFIWLAVKSDAICEDEGTGVIGYKDANMTTDFEGDGCDGPYLVLSRYHVPETLATGKIKELCAFLGASNSTINYSLAIYGDDEFGEPTDLLVHTSVAISNNGTWNCLPISPKLTVHEGSFLWFAFMNNEVTCETNGNLFVRDSVEKRSFYGNKGITVTFPTFPDTVPDGLFTTTVAAFYATYDIKCQTDL